MSTTQTQPQLRAYGSNDLHAVFATTAAGDTVRVSDPLAWDKAHFEWSHLDELRRVGRLPHVRHFEVRSVWLGPDRALVGPDVLSHDRYDRAPVELLYTRPVLEGSRGFKNVEDAAKKAWKLYAPEFTDNGRYVKHLRSRGYLSRTEVVRSTEQGRGGTYYYPNGRVVARDAGELAKVAKRRGMVVQGNDGRWYVLQDVVPVPV